MYFHSLQFLAFLGIAFVAYWTVHRSKPARLAVLLVASLLFYAAWTPLPLVIFVSCAAVDHLVVRGMARFATARARKLLLAASIVSNLAVLGTFKYADLLYSSTAWILGHLGIAVRYEPLGLLLPVGLSFVVFQAISLTVDVYRGQVKPTFGYAEHLLYLLFFPQVVAGPIVRARDLLEHFDRQPALSADVGARALFRITAGLVKKLVIADVLAAAIVDPVFANPGSYTSAECAVAAIAYTLQLYFDFSAYSDIAIGGAALFGFPLPENFNKPYFARNLFEFWNRWHVSLSTWLRDYLYIPLGGNRVSRPRVLFNLMVVMGLGGLWHGADWRFALWGVIHGVGLIVTRVFWWWRGRPDSPGMARVALGWAATMLVVILSRVVFRASDLQTAGEMYRQLLELTPGLDSVSLTAWLVVGAAIALHALPHNVFELLTRGFVWLPVPVRAAALVAIGLAVRQVAATDVRPYIYFQF
jgi:alginate O-acetyltransferase complex protein AlgI